MKLNGKKMMFALAAVAFLGLGGYAFDLTRTKAALNEKIARESIRMEQYQRKYGECRKESEALLSVKTGLEGRQRAVQAETETALEELKTGNAALKSKMNALEQRLALMGAERDKLSKALEEKQALERKTRQELERRTEANEALERAKKGVDEKLRKAELELDRARTRNGELCSISLELLKRYKDKGIFGAVADKEPLTQIGRAKLEEAVQEYKDKIEALRLKPQAK